jgi:hypothetical protein
VKIQTSAGAATTFAMPIAGTPAPASTDNPEIIASGDDGATNTLPTFPAGSAYSLPGVTTPGFTDLPEDGPVFEVRFVTGLAASGNEALVRAGAVGNLFTIQGRGDLPTGCSISQLAFSSLGANSISFRIPTPTYGLGFVQSTPDPILIQNAANSKKNATSWATANGLSASGINFGVFNTSGNTDTITRFGWKAQNASLLMFAGEAENVEMGVTNELFPNERTWGATSTGSTLTVPPCIDVNRTPEDELLATGTQNLALVSSNFELDSIFMLLNGAPSQCDVIQANINSPYGSSTPSCPAFTSGGAVSAGQTAFTTAGCSLCHSPQLVTGPSPNGSLSNQTYAPYSDFELHHMGGLDDGIPQGKAGGDQFRTAPLWGLGQRLFFMHDGRDTNLINAIEDHCIATTSTTISASEACNSVGVFNKMTTAQQQDLLYFLRSL